MQICFRYVSEGWIPSLADDEKWCHKGVNWRHSDDTRRKEGRKRKIPPLKEKKARKEEGRLAGNARTRTREEQISLADAVALSHNIPALSVDLRKPPTLAEAIAYARLTRLSTFE